ncbi:uncharacterized protein LOC104891695 isoform X1 [Beta vulgaris subsp. vulgaris]|uniref:uncharacterized protein LOC104891695 isoform X1 n=1 Tax=Beta vulgaris subsp. vulgaris TaxID=3555 RepID=UPI00203676E7|nr:uncharacterized protein LOC104891695 isoform X1 [Beta vulgaris subsp. vulgaris]
MANLPQSLSLNAAAYGPLHLQLQLQQERGLSSSSSTNSQSNPNNVVDRKMQSAELLVLDLSNPDRRENALLELSKGVVSGFGAVVVEFVWNYCCTFAGDCVNILCAVTTYTKSGTVKPCLQCSCSFTVIIFFSVCYMCVASHPDTRMLFLNAHIPLYLYPFLNTTSKSRPFEYLRLTSLGVIGALVKVDDTEVISFLLSTEIIPLCLRTMEMGSELSKTVATFIVQKILLDDVGLDYICTTAERFFAVGRVLANMVAALAEQPSSRLLKHIIRCYLRLSDNPRACDALRSCLPDMLKDATFASCLREDPTTRKWLQQLLHNVGGQRVTFQPGTGFEHMLVN